MATPTLPSDKSPAVEDWRASVLQSYRNAEVREIAKVLAALEPGATSSSKLMLAMRFEDTIFKQAASLVDYRKRISKRLKKLQKNYVPPATKAAGASDTEVLMLELRRKYGEALQFISKNASIAISDVKERTGIERSNQLKQHTDSAVSWAKKLGVWEEAPESVSAAAAKVSETELQRLKQHLELRVENIQTYVTKHADPDRFLRETLERKDKELKDRANKMLGVNLSKRFEQIQEKSAISSQAENKDLKGSMTKDRTTDAMKVLQESLEKSQTPIPAPTRNSSNDIPAALIHIERMRAASTALLSYFCIPNRHVTAPREALAKILSIPNEGYDFVKQVTAKMPKASTNKVKLEDAWNKAVVLPREAPPLLDSDESPTKRQRLVIASPKPYIKSRVLLTPNRKTPSNLIPALKRKGARLIRPPYGSRGSHLVLEFEEAFTMTIYFSPLLVTLRAMETGELGNSTKPVMTQLNTIGCASWTPLYHGLTDKNDLCVWGVNGGTYSNMGRVVEERLRDASTQATYTLRKCFQNHVKDKTLDFEVEILEASALLEFLQLARSMFMPNWQDDD